MDPTATAQGCPPDQDRVAVLERALAESEGRLAAMVEQQRLLFREINHRVKNSLQMVASLLSLHREKVPDPGQRRVFDDMVARVHMIAHVHRMLYQGSAIEEVDVAELLQEMAQPLESLSGGGLAIRADRLLMPADLAIPVGLCVNELVTNAQRHAYPNGSGPVAVDLRVDGGQAVLTVADKGGGGLTEAKARDGALGLLLVRALAAQVGARLSFASGPQGTAVTLDWQIQGA